MHRWLLECVCLPLLIVLVAGCGGGSSGSSQTQTPTLAQIRKLDAMVTDLVTTNFTPGIAVGISHHGKTIYTKAAGNRTLSPDQPVLITTPFEIGSVTKQFTTAGILLLVQNQTIALTDPLPHLRSSSSRPVSPRPIRPILDLTFALARQPAVNHRRIAASPPRAFHHRARGESMTDAPSPSRAARTCFQRVPRDAA